MNLTRLRYFLAVADELHFGRAADRLQMAQPPLSQQIRILEKSLGLELFARTTRSVALTSAGEALRPGAQRLVAAADSLSLRMEELRTGTRGSLRLGFVDSASYQIMPTVLNALRQMWPDGEFELRTLSSDEQHRALVTGDIDLGIGRVHGPDDDVDAVSLLDEPIVVAVHVDHELAHRESLVLEDLAGETLVGFDRRVSPSLHAEMFRLFSAHGVGYDPVIEATEYTSILGLVASGQGLAVVPGGVQTFRPPSLRYVRLENVDATSSMMLMSRAGESSPFLAAASQIIVSVLDDHVPLARMKEMS